MMRMMNAKMVAMPMMMLVTLAMMAMMARLVVTVRAPITMVMAMMLPPSIYRLKLVSASLLSIFRDGAAPLFF